jgi:hypothetical protein
MKYRKANPERLKERLNDIDLSQFEDIKKEIERLQKE